MLMKIYFKNIGTYFRIINQKSDVDGGRCKDQMNQNKQCYTHNYYVNFRGSHVDIRSKPIGLNWKLVAIPCNQGLIKLLLKNQINCDHKYLLNS